jgi:hypothetical protein
MAKYYLAAAIGNALVMVNLLADPKHVLPVMLVDQNMMKIAHAFAVAEDPLVVKTLLDMHAVIQLLRVGLVVMK